LNWLNRDVIPRCLEAERHIEIQNNWAGLRHSAQKIPCPKFDDAVSRRQYAKMEYINQRFRQRRRANGQCCWYNIRWGQSRCRWGWRVRVEGGGRRQQLRRNRVRNKAQLCRIVDDIQKTRITIRQLDFDQVAGLYLRSLGFIRLGQHQIG